ncbi:MAG: glycoside hydrolase family 2, partial [Bacteroidales bacterium]|nr:glycoside hydrolase family 2 [Bacteroidales bacterium]
MNKRFLIIPAILGLLAGCASHPGNRLQTPVNDPIPVMRKSFVNPPGESRVRAYWWWLNGNVTKESITRDLEEMKKKGYGGALLFDAGSSNYRVAKKTSHGPAFGSPQWTSLLQHTVRECDRLGLELSLNIQSGWNLGGPPVQPSRAMKKLVWSELKVDGPRAFSGTLPQPEHHLFYRDITVQAIKIAGPSSYQPIQDFAVKSLIVPLGWKGIYPLDRLQKMSDDHSPGIPENNILDISSHLVKGKLTWKVPPGEWIILRYGMTCTIARVSTCSDDWRGLALDHLNRNALITYFSKVVDPLISAAKTAGNSLKYLYTDSWEMGVANWTQGFKQQFIRFRGYDPTPYLPVLTNRIVGNRLISNQFLRDFRKTVGDCITENHYGTLHELAAARGLGIHPESGGPHSAPINAINTLSKNDFPMGEYWARSHTHRITKPERLAVKQSASVAHIYGKRFVAAEGPTSIGPQWERSPRDLKNVIDRVFCSGVNRIIWHTFTSSPVEAGLPGNEYFAGTHLNPNVTWWPVAGAFISYLNRCSCLLSQGLFVADVLYYYGDDVPNFVFLREEEPDIPGGYHWDKCNKEVILNRITIRDGKILLPDGMQYRMLVLPKSPWMDLTVLKKIRELVDEGMILVGTPPRYPGGILDEEEQVEFARLVSEIWGTQKKRQVGKEWVYTGYSVPEVLNLLDIQPDMTYTGQRSDTKLDFIHRSTPDADIYFIENKWAWDSIHDEKYRYIPATPDRIDRVMLSFRVNRGVPELWDPVTGKMSAVTDYQLCDDRITLPTTFGPEASKFIFISRKSKKNKTLPVSPCLLSAIGSQTADTLRGPWRLQFDPEWGPASPVILNKLKSWTEFKDPEIRYYSGSAVYSTHFNYNLKDPSRKIIIDPGNVQELCELKINGSRAVTLWFPPFLTDITDLVKEGDNLLEIKVYNLWPNRLIGDGLLPPGRRRTKTNVIKFDQPDA